MPSLGIHVSKNSVLDKNRNTIIEAIAEDCAEYKLSACQIFVQGPQSSVMNKMDYNEIKEYCHINKIDLYVHSSYITVGIFSINDNNKNETKYIKSIKNLTDQLNVCDKLNAKGLVVHINKIKPDDLIKNLKIYAKKIYKYKTPLILEQPAKKADGELTYETPEKINKITKLINDTFPKLNWGWCLDTCHLWSGGINLSNITETTKWFADLDFPEKVKLFHINGGNNSIFGTGKDYHIIPFSSDDDIWGTDKNTIPIITKFIKKYKCDSILEIKRGNQNDINYAIKYIQELIIN